MSSTAAKRLSPAEYLNRERAAEFKSEFYDGEVFAMAGGSPMHSLISANLIRCVGICLEGRPCRTFNSDLRVATPSGLYTYPDATVVCGSLEYLETARDMVTNPLVLFEVLSPSTEAYDRGWKFRHYRKIDSLRAYVLVAQDQPCIEIFSRSDDDGKWLIHSAEVGEIEIPPLGITVSLDGVYQQVEFPPDTPSDRPE